MSAYSLNQLPTAVMAHCIFPYASNRELGRLSCSSRQLNQLVKSKAKWTESVNMRKYDPKSGGLIQFASGVSMDAHLAVLFGRSCTSIAHPVIRLHFGEVAESITGFVQLPVR